MPAPATVVFLAMLAALPLAAQDLDAEQSALLEQARQAALRYSDSLPNFLCTQIVQRSQDVRGDGRWRALDKLTVRLSYSEHKEDYKLMQINGKDTLKDFLSVGGALSTGEFGTRLFGIFDPRSHAEFHWKGWTTLHKRRVARFSYRVAQEHTSYLIQYGDAPKDREVIIVPYHGEVVVEEGTNMILRLTQEAEIPAGFPISWNESWVEYDYADVGGKSYLLPVHAYSRTRSGRFVAENNIDFRAYRKFQIESSITFEPATDKQ
jgi:hypothetical protein